MWQVLPTRLQAWDRLLAAAGFLVVAGLLAVASSLPASAGSPPIRLQFANHLQAKLPEQDVFVERVAGSGEVYRVTAADREASAPLYAAAEAVRHNPFDPKAVGPYRKGRALGLTLGQWLAARGSGTYSCAGGHGTVRASFAKLVPNGVYTLWYFFLPMPPTRPFTGTLDLPLGARDGSQNTLRTDAQGTGTYRATFTPCLQLSGEQLAAGLALAWHSDGKTYASDAGPFGLTTHVQLFLLLPGARGM
jgi:hypothetical protein